MPAYTPNVTPTATPDYLLYTNYYLLPTKNKTHFQIFAFTF